MKNLTNRALLVGLAIGLVLVRHPATIGLETQRSDVGQPKSRVFRIDYGATLDHLRQGASVRVWLPVPQSSDHQYVTLLDASLPAHGATAIEPKYGNKILYFEPQVPPSGRISFRTTYQVRRLEVRGLARRDDRRAELADEQRKLYLSANRKVPLSGRHLELLAGIEFPEDTLAVARTLYELVDRHVRYDKSKPGYGQGDVLWVCDSGFGNCTDFHSLFIALARARGLPAQFEIGFPLPPDRGAGSIAGYHCWAMFYVDNGGWIPVDISEADKHPEMKDYYFGNLTEDRVTFTAGRDIDLVPRQSSSPLNFFIYPYVEVDGKPLPTGQMQMAFAYADVDVKEVDVSVLEE